MTAIRTPKRRKRDVDYRLLLYAAPFLILILIFNYLPIIGWIYAFSNYKPGMALSSMKFVGLNNFIKAVTKDRFLWTVLRNTLALSGLNLSLSFVPIVFALLLTELGGRHFKKVVQTLSTIPFYISWITVYSLAFAFFATEGLVYQFAAALGFTDLRVNILANPNIAWRFQAALNQWKTFGYYAIIYFAAISGVDQELYDAAKVDGAGRWRSVLHITLPGIAGTFYVLFLLGVSNILSNGFDQYFAFHNSLVAEKIEVLDYYVYSVALRNNDIPFATAIGMYKTLISVILLTLGNLASKKLRGESMF